MTPTATYIAEENCLQELPQEEAPLMPDLMDYNSSDDYIDAKSRYSQEVVAYNAHLATLRKIPCDISCKGLWADQQKVVEGKDCEIEFRDEACYDDCDTGNCQSAAECKYVDETALIAFPLVSVKSEDENWREMLQTVFDHHVSGYDANMDYNRAIVELKSKYLPLTKR